MATISNTPRPGYVWDSTDNVWYPIGVGGHSHSEIAKTIADAKGDLIVGTAADTVDRLAVGNNGETLVADSSTSTGLRYQAPVQQNPVLNSAMQIWQRGTTITASSSAYGPDRFNAYRNAAGATVSRQTTSDTTNLPFIQYCARVQRDNANTSADTIYLYQSMETVYSIPFVGKTVTLSFYARKGALFSSTSSELGVRLNTGTGTDQNWASYTGGNTAISQSATLTTSWQRFSYTSAAVIGTTVNELAISFGFTPAFGFGYSGSGSIDYHSNSSATGGQPALWASSSSIAPPPLPISASNSTSSTTTTGPTRSSPPVNETSNTTTNKTSSLTTTTSSSIGNSDAYDNNRNSSGIGIYHPIEALICFLEEFAKIVMLIIAFINCIILYF
jgi:hypothetical protein